jgi:hypothetical protein
MFIPFPALGVGEVVIQQGAVRHDTADDFCMIFRIARRAPHAYPTKIAAAAIATVERAVDLAPGMTAALLHATAATFRKAQSGFDFLVGVTRSTHA